ncbi:class I SAM-dependent methyltransferase [Mycobacterium sp. NPDC006124]|uniref:O-methyltransferase n=1 Tax=Mycobacterium sp. NPDC006124 TaxID=3156729 RepID=UPI0033B0E0CD
MNDAAVLDDARAPLARPVTPSTILAQELSEVCRQLAGGGAVDAAVLQRLQRARDLAAGLDPYLDQCSSPESPALTDLARRTRGTDWGAPEAGGGRLEQEMLSGHVEGQVLKFLVHLADARRVLEIGMFTGYSALAMAEALPEDGVVVACEIDPDVARFAEECFDGSPAGRKISVEVGPAIESLRRLAASSEVEPFDFVFVDADKAGYLDYVEFLLAGDLLAPRAVIAVDNTLMQGQPYGDTELTANGAAIASFNAALTYDSRVEQVLIPLRDGLTLIRRVP